MKKHFILVALVCVLAAFMTACGGTTSAATLEPTVPPVIDSTAPAAEGNLEPLQSVNLSFGVGGEVAEVLVKEGDSVKSGDVIARLRADSLQVAVAQAEAGVAVAKANLTQYQDSLPQQIAAAEADVKSAQAQIAAASAKRDNSAALIDAEAALAQAQFAQQQAQTAYDKVLEYKRFVRTEEQARLALNTALKNTQAAQARVDALKTGSPSDRADGAQVAAEWARRGAAQARLDQLKAEAEGTVESTDAAAVKQAEAALLAAQANLAETELHAPFTGTVARIDLKAGERVAPGTPIVILADFSGWRITTDDLTEIKVLSIEVGQTVTIEIDALPELALKGEVESIGAVSQQKSGDVTYPVKIKLIDSDPRLRWGMTVAVTFGK